MTTENMAEKVRALRNSHRMNMSQISKLCGVPYRTWLKWESGERACPDYVFELIKFYLENREK